MLVELIAELPDLFRGELFYPLIKERQVFNISIERSNGVSYLFASMVEQLFCQLKIERFVLHQEPWCLVGDKLYDCGIDLWWRGETIPGYHLKDPASCFV